IFYQPERFLFTFVKSKLLIEQFKNEPSTPMLLPINFSIVGKGKTIQKKVFRIGKIAQHIEKPVDFNLKELIDNKVAFYDSSRIYIQKVF
ncbi:unnamed protein product, partial [marine sediment metagenome]